MVLMSARASGLETAEAQKEAAEDEAAEEAACGVLSSLGASPTASSTK